MSISIQLATMIFPQLEQGSHDVEFLGMATGDFSQSDSGEVKAKNTINGVISGCFPQLYGTLAGNMSDQVITL